MWLHWSLALLHAHAMDMCWPKNVDNYFRKTCCDNVDMQCFNGIYTYESCCLGAPSPFASWPLGSVMLGYPGCGTTSISALLTGHPNISLVARDPQGRAWKKHEMQALNMLLEANSHSLIQRFGKALARDQRSRNLYMSDPTLLMNGDKVWAMSQIPRAKFLVMLRDPVKWLASRLCHTSCSPERMQLGLCDASGRRAPMQKWLQHCHKGDSAESLQSWELCTRYSLMSPYISLHLRNLWNNVLKKSPGRLAAFSLEAVKEDPEGAMDALEEFLRLPRRRQGTEMPKRNVHGSFQCQDEMVNYGCPWGPMASDDG